MRAGLVRDPIDWPWSSIRALLGEESPLPFFDVQAVLREFGTTTATARRRLRTFLRDGLEADRP